MKIAYVSTFDARLVQSWSGTGYIIAKELERQGVDISYVGPLSEKNGLFYKAKQLFYREILKKRHIRQAEPAILHHNALQISEQISIINPDIILSIWAYPIAFLECKQPIVFIADATFPLMHDYYNEYTNLSTTTINNISKLEKSDMDRSAAVIYSSNWAAQSAINDYGISPNKVHVIPFGAIINSVPTKNDVENFIENRVNSDVCNLLFLGVDWERKGGRIAYNTLLELLKKGMKVQLTVCGCIPPDEFSHSKMQVIPFLDKSNNNDSEQFTTLLRESHFLLLPTRKEAYGLVFCEASAFALPSITTDTGGVGEIIQNGINGYTLPFSSDAIEYAELISTLWINKEEYYNLSQSSYNEFTTRLNWDFASEQIKIILEKLR